jgi:glucose/arabinose dehydrogenase
MRALAAVVAAALAAPAAPAAQGAQAPSEGLRLVPVVSGLENPVHLAAPAGDARLFIVEQYGRIRIVKNGRLLPRPFLDITREVGSGGERGLLSVAFHPQYRRNGRFYVDYTDHEGHTHIARFTADPAADTASASTEQLVLFIEQPYANHNGGHVLFGPDGMLYVGMGDGGSQMDPHGNGQNTGVLLAKLLRLDVDAAAAGEPYAIPAGNPFVKGGGGGGGGRHEIWATGLRNPWRIAFDSGLIYIADVGQNSWEEVDVAPAAAAGLNYGWRRMEGAHCFILPLCSKSGLTLPALEYSHRDGCAIIGGMVYRGRAVPALAGRYLYSDYCTGFLRSFHYVGGVATDRRTWSVPNVGQVTSFGEDSSGEVYVLSETGTVYRIVAR